jgi:hypothetical protein
MEKGCDLQIGNFMAMPSFCIPPSSFYSRGLDTAEFSLYTNYDFDKYYYHKQ